MGSRKSLGQHITKYAIFELLYTFFVILFFAMLLNWLVNINLVYPANYAERQIENVKKSFQRQDWKTDDLPYYYEYRFTENGNVEQTIAVKYNKYIEKAVEDGIVTTNNFLNSKVFVHIKDEHKDLVLSYRLSAIFAYESLYNKIENFELFYYLIVLVVWIGGFIILIKRSIKVIKSELQKVSRTNLYLQNMDLDYPREESKYKEIIDMLSSLDALSKDLKISLSKQWTMQEHQRELIESITHDIRTPITLIKGNLELLKEDKIPNTEERIQDMENGVSRLETYIDILRNHSVMQNHTKRKAGVAEIEYWISIMETICKAKDRKLLVVRKETSSILLEKENIAIALQNVIVNSIENSDKNSNIKVSFIDEEENYRIEVVDEGSGFANEIIEKATDKYVTTKNHDSEKHGLGLYIVKEILMQNKGELILENYQNGLVSGAKVTLCFRKH